MASVDDVRKIALSLPGTTEEPWYGTPAYKVKGKGFLRLRTEAEGGLVVFVSEVGQKDMLLSSDPNKFFTTPHYGDDAILVKLPAIRTGQLRELITDSWRLKAPAQLVEEFDAGRRK